MWEGALESYLLEKGLISKRDLLEAKEFQKRSGEKLSRVLLSLGFVKRRDLYRALSEVWHLPYVSLCALDESLLSKDLLERWPLEKALHHRAVPFAKVEHTWVAVAGRPDQSLLRSLESAFPDCDFQFMVTTEWDIDAFIRKYYRNDVLQGATWGLFYRSPAESAYSVFTPSQFGLLALGLVGLFLGLYLAPRETLFILVLLVNLFFFASVAFKFFLSMAGAGGKRKCAISDEEVRALSDKELPTYTILAPVYREANVVGHLLRGLAQLDYPKDKLEVLVLLEENDQETIEAAKRAKPPEWFRLVIVPDGLPKTKPKACNVGLYFARGEYLVIYDAEDLPEPDQLKKAYLAFKKGPPEMVCVQATLNYYNRHENFLTRMFTLEYSYWFDYLLEGLYRLKLPIPLGGTSNHFHTHRLRELGGWDPFNVTEDADLGIRASMRGYVVGVIDSTTYEEANNSLFNWIRQRSRWIKGYMQTLLVHSRQPVVMLRKLGFKQALTFLLLVGGTPLSFLAYLPIWMMFLYWLLGEAKVLDAYFSGSVLYIALFNLLFGNLIGIYLNMLAVLRRGYYELTPYALLNPFYWVLHSLASYKALWDLFARPFHWEKTQHGLSKGMAVQEHPRYLHRSRT